MSLFQDIEYLTVTIGAGASLSDAAPMGAQSLVGVVMPSGWDAADLTFQASPDGGTTWCELNWTDGTATTAIAPIQIHSPAASQFIAINPDQMRGVNQVKVRSGTVGAPVNQSAARTLTLVVRGAM